LANLASTASETVHLASITLETVHLASTTSETVHLAPTYDHASSLGRDLSDSQRQKRSVEAYANKCFSAFYGNVDDKKPLKTVDVFDYAARCYPNAAHIWLERLEGISKANILDILNRIPNTRISPIAADFAQKILEFNQHLNTEDHYVVGYCPRYLNSEIFELLLRNPSLVEVRVEQVNQPPTPLQFRLLCNIIAQCYDEFCPFSSVEYQPLSSYWVLKNPATSS